MKKKYTFIYAFTVDSQIEILPRFSFMYGECDVHGIAIEWLFFSFALIKNNANI